MRVSTGSDVLSAPFIEQFAMIFRRGRGRGRDFGGRERGSVRGRGSYGGKQNASEKGPRQCRHCRRSNHISEKCWEKLGQPEWAQLSESDPPASCGTPRVSSSAHPGSSTVVLLREEYDRLCKLEFSQNNLSTTCASVLDMHAYTSKAMDIRLLVLIPHDRYYTKVCFFKHVHCPPSVRSVDGTHLPVLGNGAVQVLYL